MFRWTFVVQRVIWGKYNIGFGIPIKFPSQRRKKLFKSVHIQGNWTLVVQRVIWGKYNIGFGLPIKFQSQKKKIFKSVHKQEIRLLWSSESFEVRYNIGFGIPIKFPSQRKKNIQISPYTRKLDFCGQASHFGKVRTISDLESPSNFQVKEKKYLNRSLNKKLDFFGPVSHLRESTISDFESPSNFQVKERKPVHK